MKVRFLCAAVFVLTIATGGSLLAHHSFAMFEMEKDVTYKGVVVEYKWINPHTHITMEIKPGPGVDPSMVGLWDVEGGSTNIMGRQGWTRSTFKAGEATRWGRQGTFPWPEVRRLLEELVYVGVLRRRQKPSSVARRDPA